MSRKLPEAKPETPLTQIAPTRGEMPSFSCEIQPGITCLKSAHLTASRDNFSSRVFPVRLLAIVFIVSLSQIALAEKVRVKFRCQPKDAVVSILDDELQPEKLGKAGELLAIEAQKFNTFVFSAEGYYESDKVGIALAELEKGVWPESGALKLKPQPWTRVKSFLPPLFGIALIAGFALRHMRRKKAIEEEQAARIAFLESLQSEAKTSRHTALGHKLGNYLLTAFLGQGGMAVVYRGSSGKDHKTGEQVAVKVLSAIDDKESIERFQREVKICQKLIHPNIVALHDWGEDGELIYLAMELVEGGTLDERIKEGVDYREALRFFDEILSAMHFAHGQGVTHRDLKPENVMLTKAGKVKVADFGLAKLQTIKTVTISGAVMGTPAYMAPEQIQGGDPSPSMDQYSLGVLGYELFTGQLPFESQDMMGIITKHLLETPEHPQTIKEDLPSELCDVLMKMLEKEPENRFTDLSEIRRVLAEL